MLVIQFPQQNLQRIVKETIDFEIPLVSLDENIFSLELFHGPTLAFKDVGARFMSRCLGYFAKERKEKVTVLVATSGIPAVQLPMVFMIWKGLKW